MKKTIKDYGLYILITLGLLVYELVAARTLNPLYYEGAIFWAVAVSLYTLAWSVKKIGSLRMVQDENGRMRPMFTERKPFPKVQKYALIGIWSFLFLMFVYSSVIFQVGKYKNQMPENDRIPFESRMKSIDTKQIPIVDESMAKMLADKKLGERQALGSQVYVGEPTIQQVNGKLVWVAPLHHSGFLKWVTNMSGTPGYIIVSATDTQDVTFVEDYKVKYHPNSYFFHDITRKARFSGGLFTGITDYSFELDDSGQPYWVITTYKNTAGFNLPEATGAILLNATTGKSEKFAINELPEWVDRVQPEEFVLRQLNNKGKYVHGIFNFTNKDKYKTSDGDIIIYNDGNCYLFTGLTSIGADESAIGFVMIDMVTKEPVWYDLSGATEEAAQKSAEGNVQQYGYRASFPLVINLDGVPTYFMTLKDSSGLIKQFALVNVKDYLIVGVGDSVQGAINSYKKVLVSGSSGDTQLPEGTEKKTLQGKVSRIASETKDGAITYRLIVDEQADIIFFASSSLSDELALTKEGDKVKIEYYDTGSPIVQAESFDNLQFKQRTE